VTGHQTSWATQQQQQQQQQQQTAKQQQKQAAMTPALVVKVGVLGDPGGSEAEPWVISEYKCRRWDCVILLLCDLCVFRQHA